MIALFPTMPQRLHIVLGWQITAVWNCLYFFTLFCNLAKMIVLTWQSTVVWQTFSRLPCYVFCICLLTQQINIQMQISWVGQSTSRPSSKHKLLFFAKIQNIIPRAADVPKQLGKSLTAVLCRNVTVFAHERWERRCTRAVWLGLPPFSKFLWLHCFLKTC